MADELAGFWVTTTEVSTYEGSGPFGEMFADPVEVPCFIDNTRTLVRDQNGREVTAEATITGPIHHGNKFQPESVTTIDGEERTVITLAKHFSGMLNLPDHFEATTT